MRLFIFISILLWSSTTSAEIQYDKKMHALGSMGLGAATQFVFDDQRVSWGVCMGAGLAKELYDEHSYGGFDEKDLLADTIGCAAGIYGLRMYHDRGVTGVEIKLEF